MRAALYIRVSTNTQETENQRLQLTEYCAREKWEIAATYTDEGQSGAREDRPALRNLFRDARERKFDVLLFWSLDRFSREGVLKTILRLTEIEAYGIKFVSYSEPYLSTLGPFRDAIIALLAALAKQEKVRLSERVIAGLQRAKAEGKRIGRPPLDGELIEKVLQLRRARKTYGQIANQLKLKRSSVSGICRRRLSQKSLQNNLLGTCEK